MTRPPDRWAERLRRLALGIAGATGLLAMVLFAFWTYELPRQQQIASHLVAHTLEVLRASSELQLQLERLTSEGRGYLVDRAEDSYRRFEAAAAALDGDVAALRAMTSDNPQQQDVLNRLEPMIAARVGELRKTTGFMAAGDEAAALANARGHRGRMMMDRVMDVIAGVEREERRLLDQHEAAAQLADRRTTVALVASSTIVVLSALLSIGLLMGRKREHRHLVALSRVNTALEARVAQRTAQLAASVDRQRSYFDLSPIGMFVMRVDPDGRFVHEDMNPAAETIYALPRGAVLGRSLWEVWLDPVVSDAERRLAACVGNRQPVHYTVTREAGDAVRLLDVQHTPLVDRAGEVRHVLTCVQDVTQQRGLEQQVLAQAERQVEAAERETALFRNSPDILFVVRVEEQGGEPAFVYEAFSPALERLTGRRVEDLIGRTPADCVSQSEAEAVEARYRQCIAEGGTISYASRRETPLGPREFEGSLTPLRHATSGRITRLIGTARDVTERNRTEAALRQSQKMEAIGRLAAGVAHDFNNILQCIVGGLELVLDDVAPGTDAFEFAGSALGSARRGATLTHHLLSYARQQMLRPTLVALPGFMADFRRLLGRTLGPGVTIEISVDPEVPPILADPGQFETALLNLAINASQAMPQGGTLAIEATERIADRVSWVAITVTDTGLGMDAATLAVAVEPFFTTKGLEGTGLGLSMVQGFAEQSGGRFAITSTPGQGTTVELRLPAALPEIRPREVLQTASTRGAGRILLVDDESDVLVTTGAFLKKTGFSVVRAANADAALTALAGRGRFDALVTDYAMPGLTGAELAMEARLIQPALPIVITTGYVGMTGGEVLAPGAALLHKPFQREDLLAALRQVMGEVPQPSPARAAPVLDEA